MTAETVQQESTEAMVLLQPIPLGLDEIDHTHDEFIELVNGLIVADNERFALGFDELMKHMELHIGREDQLMLRSNYPARTEHQSDHLRILGQLAHFRKRVNQGRLTMARAFVRSELPNWFNIHVTNMDATLAAHVQDTSRNYPLAEPVSGAGNH